MLQEGLSQLRRLRNHPLWGKAAEFAEEQVATRAQEILLTAVEGPDMVYRQEFMKGEITGLLVFVSWVEDELATIEGLVKQHEQARAGEGEADYED